MYQFSERKIEEFLQTAKDLINEVETTPSASSQTWHQFKMQWLEVMTEYQKQKSGSDNHAFPR